MSYEEPQEIYLFGQVFQSKPGIAAKLAALSNPQFATTAVNVTQTPAAVLSHPQAVTHAEDTRTVAALM
jgi:hypothetical protein